MKNKLLTYGLLFMLLPACGASDGQSDIDTLDEDSSAIEATVIANGTYVIKSPLTGKCIDISGASKDDGAKVQEWTCNRTPAQLFEITNVGDNYYKLINAASSKGLDVKDVSQENDALIHQWNYVAGPNQQFYFMDRGDSNFSIHPRHTQKAIDIPNGKPDDGTQLIQWTWWGGDMQKWRLEKATKIMPLGASTVFGQGGANAGFRGYLHDMLKNAGVSFQYVGNSTENPGNLPAGQTHQEGHPGYVITAGTSGRSGITDNLPNWIGPTKVQPDVILLLIGTNDVDLNYDLAHAKDRMSNLVSMVSNKSTGLAPNAKLIVGQVQPIGEAAADARAVTYNEAIARVVSEHRAAGENVRIADMHSAVTPADLADKLHPNENGYRNMAQVWFNAITAP